MKKAITTTLSVLCLSFVCGLGLHGGQMAIYWLKGELSKTVYICVNSEFEEIPCG